MVVCVSRSNPVKVLGLDATPNPRLVVDVQAMVSLPNGSTLIAPTNPPGPVGTFWYHTGTPFPSSTMA